MYLESPTGPVIHVWFNASRGMSRKVMTCTNTVNVMKDLETDAL